MLALFQVDTPPLTWESTFDSCHSIRCTYYTQATGWFCHILITSVHSTCCYKDLVAKQHTVLTGIIASCDVFPQPVPTFSRTVLQQIDVYTWRNFVDHCTKCTR